MMQFVDVLKKLQVEYKKEVELKLKKKQEEEAKKELEYKEELKKKVDDIFKDRLEPIFEYSEELIKEEVMNGRKVYPLTYYRNKFFTLHNFSKIFSKDIELDYDFEVRTELCHKTKEFFKKINKDKKWGLRIDSVCGNEETWYDGDYGGYQESHYVKIVIP